MRIFTKDRTLTPSWKLLKPNWELLKKNILPTLYLYILPTTFLTYAVLISEEPVRIFGEVVIQSVRPDSPLELILLLAGFAWVVLTYPGFLRMQVRAIQGKSTDALENFKAGVKRVPALVANSLLVAILISLGFILFIIPGLFLLRGLLLSSYYVADKELGPIQAIKQSYNDSRSVSAWIWGLIGVVIVINIVASLFSEVRGLGTVLSIIVPLAYIYAIAIRYGEVTGIVKPSAVSSTVK